MFCFFLLVLGFWLQTIASYSQLRYPVVGQYLNKSAQAMAIWQETAYIFNDCGHCRVYDLKNNDLVTEYDLSSYNKNNHVNAASFGVETPNGSDIPYLYVAEYKVPSRCFVEKIQERGSVLIQSIQAQKNGKILPAAIWTVDRENRKLYCLIRNTAELQNRGYATNTIIAFRLPKISEGKEVVLNEDDIVSEFVVPFPNGVQDAIIKKGYMYIAAGLQQSSVHQPNSQRAIIVVDLEKKSIKKMIDLTLLTTNEPEGIDFYHKKLLLFCGQEGGIYNIKYNSIFN